MLEILIQLIILFFVIIDPLASFTVFAVASASMNQKQRQKMAFYAVAVAAILSIVVLLLGENLLSLFSTTIDEFRVAGGIILAILGIKMALGLPLQNIEQLKNNSSMAIASIIGTPLLTGPATITAIIVATHDYGRMLAGTAVGIVLIFTALLFMSSKIITKKIGKDIIRIISTLLGLITVAWGVKFIAVGIQNIFL